MSETYAQYFNKDGIWVSASVGGSSGNLPLPLPDGTLIDDYGSLSWSYTEETNIASRNQIASFVVIVVLLGLIIDDFTGVGTFDDGLIAPVAEVLAGLSPALLQWITNLNSLIGNTCAVE